MTNRAKLKSLIRSILREHLSTQTANKQHLVKESLKRSIKKIVLSEITKSDYGVGKSATNTEFVEKLEKALKKAQGDKVSVKENPIGGKIIFDDGRGGSKFQVDVYPTDDTNNHFDVTAIFQGSERFVGKNLTQDDVLEFIKDNFVGETPCLSYAEKALKKGKAPVDADFKKYDDITDKAKKASDDDDEDNSEEKEADEASQKDRADDNDKKAEEKDVKIDDELEPQLGGELVDKIEKIIDKVLSGKKDRAEPKSAYLKADKKMESPDKLVVKTKETPKLKEKKS